MHKVVVFNLGKLKSRKSFIISISRDRVRKEEKTKKPWKIKAFRGYIFFIALFGSEDGICITEQKFNSGYLLFGGRTRQMTQYAAAKTADIDPDGTLSLRLEYSGHRA